MPALAWNIIFLLFWIVFFLAELYRLAWIYRRNKLTRGWFAPVPYYATTIDHIIFGVFLAAPLAIIINILSILRHLGAI